MKQSLSILILLLSLVLSQAQVSTVLPGDANANGLVDVYDLLPIGYTLGSTGPMRFTITSDNSAPESIPLAWEESFPDGTNYIHADCNGNGVVDMLDFVILNNNLGHAFGAITPLPFPDGNPAIDPVITWSGGNQPMYANEGTVIQIPISLELPPAVAMNGLAFKLRYNQAHFQEVRFEAADNFLRNDGMGMSIASSGDGELQIAFTRLGNNPVGNGGTVGVFYGIVIDDMVGLLENPFDTLDSDLSIIDIMGVDGGFVQRPVFATAQPLKLYHEMTTDLPQLPDNALQATLFPNPTHNNLQVQAKQPFNQVVLVDMLGRTQPLYEGVPLYEWQFEAHALPPGRYTLLLKGQVNTSALPLCKL